MREFVSCGAGLTVTNCSRHQMKRGTNCSHLFCTDGTGDQGLQEERDFISWLLKSLVSNGSDTDPGKDIGPHKMTFLSESDNSGTLLLFSFTCK